MHIDSKQACIIQLATLSKHILEKQTSEFCFFSIVEAHLSCSVDKQETMQFTFHPLGGKGVPPSRLAQNYNDLFCRTTCKGVRFCFFEMRRVYLYSYTYAYPLTWRCAGVSHHNFKKPLII